MNPTTTMLARLSLSVAAMIYCLTPEEANASTVQYAFSYTAQSSPGVWQLYSGYTYNSTGGGVVFTRLGVGDYQFTFGKISPFGNVQARTHGSNTHCKVISLSPSGSDTLVRVKCTSPTGMAIDDLTVLHYYYATGTDSLQTAYLWADQPSAATYSPSSAYSYNSTGAANVISHGVDLGEYLAYLPGLSAHGGDPHVTAYGNTDDYCKIASWYQMIGGTFVAVRCFKVSGAPVDTMWSLHYTHGHTADDGRYLGTYVLGNSNWGPGLPMSYTYTPNPIFQFHPGGVTMVADNGAFSSVHIPGASSISSVIVTGVGHDNTYCTTYGWYNLGAEFVPTATCFDPAGNRIGSGYTMTLLTLAPR